MTIQKPDTGHIPAIRHLWEVVFQDDADFLDRFFSLAFSPERCVIALEGDDVAGMVHWLPCRCDGAPLAYLYAVATAPDFRNQGICRGLITAAEEAIRAAGYQGILLVPQEEGLRTMYRSFGYDTATYLSELVCAMGTEPAPMHPIPPQDYALYRRELLPKGGVIQEEETLALLAGEAQFYKGLGLLLAARVLPDGNLLGLELLGDPATAPGILCALGAPLGTFRIPGDPLPCAMYKKITPDAPDVAHFAFALD